MTKSPETNEVVEVQQTHYNPFGGIIVDICWGRNVQKRLYNGKEYDPMLGLNSYDFSARWQMLSSYTSPLIDRFLPEIQSPRILFLKATIYKWIDSKVKWSKL